MIKCLLFGHNWKYVTTDIGKRLSYNVWLHKEVQHDLTQEYYHCGHCGMWKRKTFIDHTLDETKYFHDNPIERKDVK